MSGTLLSLFNNRVVIYLCDRWEKQVGDHVAEDEVVLEIETDKTSMPVQAPGHGVIKELLVQNGATVKPGMELFKMEITGQKPAGGAAEAKPAPTPAAAPPPAAKPVPPPAAAAPPPPVSPPTPPPAAAPKPATPLSSMPVAAIRHAQSIETAVVKIPPADPTREISGTRTEHKVKMTRMRLKIAERLKDAQNVNAMLTTFNEIDMGYVFCDPVVSFRNVCSFLETSCSGGKKTWMRSRRSTD